jgi:hypothetical protein
MGSDSHCVDTAPSHSYSSRCKAGHRSFFGEHGEVLSMNSFMLQAEEEKIVAQELVKVLKSHAA